jgi:hypothetical protein
MKEYESDELFRDAARAAVACELATGFPADAALAIWASESAWGQNQTGSFNFFGITGVPENVSCSKCQTTEDIFPWDLRRFRPDEQNTAVCLTSGTLLPDRKYRYSMRRWFRNFQSIDDAFCELARFVIDSPQRYVAAWTRYTAQRPGPAASQQLLADLATAGYATGSELATEDAIEKQANIAHAIEMARKETPAK